MNSDTPVRVGIVDDSKDIIESLKTFLAYNDKVQVTCTAHNAEEFLRKIKASAEDTMPAVVITDINMPGMSGIELVKRLKVTHPHIKFLMLTVNDDEDALFEAIKAGADGYLMKDEKISTIADYTLSMMREESIPMTSRIARKTLDLLSRVPYRQKRSVNLDQFGLSLREKEVLKKLVDGKEYRTIAEELHISPHTVRKHISNIYTKLHISSKAQAINLFRAVDLNDQDLECGLRTIIIDDHKIILDSLSMMLSTIPGVVIEATFADGREVIPWLKTHEVDLIITDVNMPHLNGIDLAREVRSEFPDIKILILTVSEETIQINQARNIGIEGYLLKKANKRELQKAILDIGNGKSHYFCDTPAVA